jgi:hypothetical protein
VGAPPIRYLSSKIIPSSANRRNSIGSASDPFSPDTPGGLAGRLAALARIDPAKPIGTLQTSDGATSPEVDANRRYLTRGIAGQPPAQAFDTGAPAAPFASANDFFSPDTDASVGARFGSWPSTGFNDGRGKRASDAFSPDSPSGLAARIAALAGMDPANPNPRVLTPPEEGSYDDGLPQPWLFRALTGRLR